MGPTLFSSAYSQSTLRDHNLLSHPFTRIANNLYASPLSWRKFALTVCRVQEDPKINTRLAEAAMEISSDLFATTSLPPTSITSKGYTFEEFLDDLSTTSTSPIVSLVLSYFIRAETWVDETEVLETLNKTINKELSASQQGNRKQMLDYTPLHKSNPTGHIQPDSPYRTGRPSELIKIWKEGMASYIKLVQWQRHVYIPHYQRKPPSWYNDIIAFEDPDLGYIPFQPKVDSQARFLLNSGN